MHQSNGPQKLYNHPSSSIINWKKYKTKTFLHFDRRVQVEHLKKQLVNPEWIESHSFLPFIHFKIKFKKYITVKSTENGIVKEKQVKKKVRKIYYASHKDGYIYKYYGDILNNAYNEYARALEIDENVLAYRNNKRGKNNIDFSYEVFNHILTSQPSIIISIDFKEFFDKINHRKLKDNIKSVLQVDTLSKDWYKVFKSITQFSYIHKTNIDDFLIEKYGKKLNKKIKTHQIKRIMSPNEFRVFKPDNLVTNFEKHGIPQGSGMSAVCSNVHLIHFDKELKDWLSSKSPDALYRRYSDDVVIVIPNTDKLINGNEVKKIVEELFAIVNKYDDHGLEIQQEKTEVRFWDGKNILDGNSKVSQLDYLGFVTDGKTVRVRERSLFNFYSRAYRKTKMIKKVESITGLPGPKKSLYNLYTHLGFDYKEYGNFITYARKAHKEMSRLPARSLINNQIKRHWNKIHKKLQ